MVPPDLVNGHPKVEFRTSAIHGLGGFARVEIQNGEKIIRYLGQKISKRESIARCEGDNPYIFSLDDEWDLDGNVPENPARFLNHSCSANAESQWIEGEIWLVAIRLIHPDEEITFNYGYDMEDLKDHPCHCGSPQCVGYMVAEEFFAKVLKG